MSDDRPAISMRGVGKMYKVFSSRLDNFIDAMGLSRFVPWWRMRYREYWALRDITVDVPRGKRLGIIGCNGAGKTTLLKLITGNLPVTEGDIQVNGHVHALMTTGSGFHPEFTGRENIEASLVYQGFTSSEIKDAIEEVAEFTELEQFLDQPFKTYSAGMQARLTFATATSMSPDILIVDEVLGAGDGYFIAKSTERITRLVEDTGATVLLVSHALDQTVRFCDETIWIDRGRIVQRGPTLEVVKAYEQYLRVRNERRLRAKNKLRAAAGNDARQQFGLYNNSFIVRVIVEDSATANCDIHKVTLCESNEAYESVGVGDSQDTNTLRQAYVLPEGWSGPRSDADRHYRSISSLEDPRSKSASGSVVFHLYGILDDVAYSIDLTYRCSQKTNARVEVIQDEEVVATSELSGRDGLWDSVSIPVRSGKRGDYEATEVDHSLHKADRSEPLESLNGTREGKAIRATRRWPSGGAVLIRDVTVQGPDGRDQAVFMPGQQLHVNITLESQVNEQVPIRGAVSIFRLDGILVTHLLMNESVRMALAVGERRALVLTIENLLLGSGQYVFSVALFGEQISETDRHDLIDRAYDFEVTSNHVLYRGAIFAHPGEWSISEERVKSS